MWSYESSESFDVHSETVRWFCACRLALTVQALLVAGGQRGAHGDAAAAGAAAATAADRAAAGAGAAVRARLRHGAERPPDASHRELLFSDPPNA